MGATPRNFDSEVTFRLKKFKNPNTMLGLGEDKALLLKSTHYKILCVASQFGTLF
jgi:hypothetical protein